MYKYLAGILREIVLSLYINLERIDIFAMLNPPSLHASPFV